MLVTRSPAVLLSLAVLKVVGEGGGDKVLVTRSPAVLTLCSKWGMVCGWGNGAPRGGEGGVSCPPTTAIFMAYMP